MPNAIRSIAAALCAAAACTICFAEEQTLSTYAAFVDTVAGTARFDLTFSRPFDLLTTDANGRQADDFQFWVDQDGSNALGRTYQHLFGQLPDSKQTVLQSRNAHLAGQIELVWVAPYADPGPRDGSGWGPYHSSVPYQASGNDLSFTASLVDLQVDRDSFHYTLGIYHFGAGENGFYEGVSGRVYEAVIGPPVPEPATWLSLGLGLVVVACAAGRRRLTGLPSRGALRYSVVRRPARLKPSRCAAPVAAAA